MLTERFSHISDIYREPRQISFDKRIFRLKKTGLQFFPFYSSDSTLCADFADDDPELTELCFESLCCSRFNYYLKHSSTIACDRNCVIRGCIIKEGKWR